MLAQNKANQHNHCIDVAIGRKAYLKGRPALNSIQVETLFDGVQPFLMKHGHRYLTKKE